MTVYYYQNGFLDTDEEAPAGAVELTASEHESLIVGQCNGQIILPGKDGKPVLADPAPCPSSTWDGEKWHIDPECAAKLKAEQQAEVWERIKQKRYDNLRQGVYVKSVGKWFQTDDATRLQYLTLRTLDAEAFPLKEPWKTMDNTYIPPEKCTKDLSYKWWQMKQRTSITPNATAWRCCKRKNRWSTTSARDGRLISIHSRPWH